MLSADLMTLLNPTLEGDSFFWPGGETGVLLFHGLTATTAEVRPLAKKLSAAGYTVQGLLLPGHGTTPPVLAQTRLKDWLEAVENAYQQIARACKTVLVGGESMGGLLALYLASQHAEIAGGLVYAPAVRIPNDQFSKILALFKPYRIKKNMDTSMAWKGYKVYPLRAVDQLYQLQRLVKGRLSTVRQPFLVVQGRLDQTIDPHGAQFLYNSLLSPEKELHWFEQSTHCILLDREFEAVAELSLNYIHKILLTRKEQ